MSFASNDIFTETLIAGADLSGSQFRFVKLNAAGRVIPCNAAGERAYGVLLNKGNTGEAVNVSKAPGGSQVELGANVTEVGDELTTNATGQAIPATGNTYVNGIAKNTGSANAQIGADLVTYNKNA